MKKILKIARLELNILFYSPIAWLILIIFIIQCGVTFTDMLYAKETNQQMGTVLESVTRDLFGGIDGFFAAVQKKLYLYIPLLTMGLMSREISSGSIKLLLSSPLTNAQIILGKFLAMMAYGGLLMLVLLGIMVSGIISIEALDIQYIIGGMLGLYLLICAYAAIGLFMSSLTSYQVVAAISTLAILAALNFVSKIGPGIDIVRDITYWLSISGRADNFINGLISSKDVVYFLMVIAMFLTLSIMKLNAGREIRSQATTIFRYSAVVSVVILIGVITSLPSLTAYYDTTRFNTNTLTPESQAIIKQLKGPVTITTYPNVVNSYAHIGAPKFRNFERRQFEEYTRYLPGIKFEYVPYYDTTMVKTKQTKTLEERAKQSATANGYDFEKLLSPKEIKKVIDLVPEDNFFTRTVTYNGKSTFLRMFFDMVGYPKEAEISAALKRLLVKPPVIGVLASNDERSINKAGDKAYKDLTNTLNRRSSLINQGFDVHQIPLAEKDTIPQDLTVLVLADPRIPYTAAQLQKIADYLAKGGNLLVSGEPGRQEELNKILKPLGVEFMPGSLLQESKDLEVDLIQAKFAASAKTLGFNYPEKTIISMPNAVGIQYTSTPGYQSTPILATDKRFAWIKSGKFDISAEKIVFNPSTEQKISVPVALAVTHQQGNKEQKIMIMGDADFMSNTELGRYNVTTKNSEFAVNLFKWFSNNEFPIDTTRPPSTDNHIIISREKISWLKIFFLGVLPVSLALAGAYSLIRRKRK